MSGILHVVGSPRGAQSTSTRLAEAFLAACCPDVEVDRLDLWAEDLPPFAGEAANGKLKAMSGQPLPPDEQAAFDRVLAHIERLKAADEALAAAAEAGAAF
jgi:FMN-dependent NADH-azoreductase